MVSSEYKAYLESDKWHDIREQIISRDDNQCALCGSRNQLQVHHISGYYRFHEEKHPETLITLCDTHHKLIHKYFEACDLLKSQYAELRARR